MLLTEVSATLVPLRRKHSPVRSCVGKMQMKQLAQARRWGLSTHQHYAGTQIRRQQQGNVLTLTGMCWLVSVKACARRNMSSTPMPSAKKGNTYVDTERKTQLEGHGQI